MTDAGPARNERDDGRASDLMADPDTASTEDTERVVPVEERIVPQDLPGPADGRKFQAL